LAQVRVGIVPQGKRPLREGNAIFSLSGESIGMVTSGAPSPTLGHPVAMGYVQAAHAVVGTELEVDIRGKRELARVVELPFYRRQV
jgi:aminomethyltransferase